MVAIKENFGEGGANLTPAGQGEPTLAQALRDIADDLAMLKAAVDQIIADLGTSTTASTTDLKTQKG
ncbi:hypothetical protein Asulf_01514 [Archaeoglobus sulfaticallidus PM70-1]|uniref:Uncharacterized protein n=1 Tax=Archaeoglobus sulfaticallidus PM70-1 TaxID=387631 RepID=N0BGW4_9EURY|nr:hypothetical protein [Archaeoglobus sulfaticallidus]AGK61497.1 hypothetical protein Asulf_01514 [Archaeoglobus sulfaticallidus PM70-1]